MLYQCNVVRRTRMRTAPDTRFESQTSEWFEVGETFIAHNVIVVTPRLEEWLEIHDQATGRVLYTAAVYPDTQNKPKRFVNYSEFEAGPVVTTEVAIQFGYNQETLSHLDVTERKSDGSHETARFTRQTADADG